MITNPTAVKILANWQYVPVPASSVAGAKIGTCQMNWAYIETAPLEPPTLTRNSTTSSKRANYFMIGAIIHDNRSGGRGVIVQPARRLRAGNIGQQSSNQHTKWYVQYRHCLMSLLTCHQPTSSLPIVEVQEPSATQSPST